MIGAETRPGLLPALAVVLFAPLVGCSSSDSGTNDATIDATVDAATDGGADLASPDAAPLAHDEMLKKLGITTGMGDPVGPDGKPLPKDYNPLSRSRTSFMPKMELFAAGFVKSGAAAPCAGTHQCLYEDKDGSYAPLHATTEDSWTSAEFKNVIGADVDGDGFDEIVAVYYAGAEKKLKIKIVDRDAAGSYTDYDGEIATGITTVPASYKHFHPTLAAGDLDGDGDAEIAVGFAKLYLVSITLDATKGASFTVTSKDYPGSTEIFVAAGDVDGDGKDELAATYHKSTGYAYIDLFDGDLSATALLSSHQLHAPNINGGHTYEQQVHVAIGDIDGDRLDEIVFNGERRDYDAWNVTVMDDAKHNFDWLGMFFQSNQGNDNHPTLALLDYNGDGLLDIFASRWVLGYKKGSTFGGNSADVVGIQTVFTEAPSNMAAGDVDGDGKDELLYYYNSQLWIGGQDATGKHEHQQIWGGSWGTNPKACAANVDDDSPVVEYAGRELQFGDPQVIAVMAAPPLYSGIGQNESSSGTSFGKSSASGVEQSQSMGVSVGFSVGYEAEAPFGLAKASFKVTVETALDWISSQSTEVEKYITYTGGADEDKVVFTAVPFDVYYYKILSSPVASEVGTMMTVNVPREMQTLSVARDFYNANNGDGDDIDSAVLKHTIGDPKSYPTEMDRDALLKSGGLQSIESPVGVGTGSVTVGIRKSDGKGSGTSFDFGVTIESEVGAGGVTMGTSVGFHYGYECNVTNTESTVFEGTVGDIPQSAYDSSKAYTFGLFAYPFTHGDQKFTVVNYWVK